MNLSRFVSWLIACTVALALIGCSNSEPAPSTPSPAPTQESRAAETPAPTASAPVVAPPASTENSSANDAPADSTESASTPTSSSAETSQGSTPMPPIAMPTGPEPRLNVDYELIDPPHPMTSEPGKVEIAEVFSYTCPHCASLEERLPEWKKNLPPQINFVQVPMAHGPLEPLARGFYAAQAMGVHDKTHSGIFRAVIDERKIGQGKAEDVARIYADLGIDAQALQATANSFAVNTQITRNQKAVARWAVQGTPTLVVAGKYRVPVSESGHDGMLRTALWLAQREAAEQSGQTAN